MELVTVLGIYGPLFWLASPHEGSALIVRDGELLAAIEEDRITRVKHDGSTLLWNSISEVLRISGVKAAEIDAVAIPWEAPKQTFLRDFAKFKLRRALGYPYLRMTGTRLSSLLLAYGIEAPIRYVNHHLSHAASAYYTSGMNDTTAITLDGQGDRDESLSSWDCQNNVMSQISMSDVSTFGDFFSAATAAIGFKLNDGEGKTMGLASYGNSDVAYDKLKDFVKVDGLTVTGTINNIVEIRVDVTDRNIFAPYRHSVRKNNPLLNIAKLHKKEDFAAAAQKLLEDRVIEYVRNVISKSGKPKVCLSGGVALNMKLNQKIREMPEVEDVYVFPNPGDSGVAVGAALLVCKELMEREGKALPNKRMIHTYYGTRYTDEEVIAALDEYRLSYQELKDPEKTAADLIAEGKVVGWFQSRLEFGPRALGNRSVLADPRDEKMKDKINKHLKKRDWFMPFAPSMLSEAKTEYLEDAVESPFMIMGFNVKKERIKDIPAVVHVDGTVRPQTVTKEANPSYWQVIQEFEKQSGIPIVLNTSFNRHGQPMVRSPQDAALHVVWGAVEYLIIHKYLVDAEVKL
jgi:carbamoyltransferase